jgi:hypothetical protein
LGDKELASKISYVAKENLAGEKLRKKLVSIVGARLKQLEVLAAKGEV